MSSVEESGRVGAAWALVLGLMGAGCASSPALKAAEKGDLAALGREVAAREKAGRLGNGEAADLGRALVEWEITRGPKDEQLTRVREVRACASAIDGALARRMKMRDAAGAEAALVRVEAGEMSEGAARGFVADREDAWRAVGARGLVRSEDDAARQHAYVDPAPAVRRAAMHAALKARDARDVEPLAEAARVDPEPIARTDAIRALAVIGGPEVAAKLRDLWTNADEPLREDIAGAWASAALWRSGGRDELRVLLAQEGGPAAIEAAGAVLRGAVRDPEIDASATALLARTIGRAGKASHRNRIHAVLVAPRPGGVLLDPLREATTDPDFTLRVAALARLVEVPAERDASLKALEAIAADKDRAAAGSRAKLALATAGDVRIQAWIEADLVSPDASVRSAAALALVALGRSGRAAPLLADADPSLRTRAACALVVAARR